MKIKIIKNYYINFYFHLPFQDWLKDYDKSVVFIGFGIEKIKRKDIVYSSIAIGALCRSQALLYPSFALLSLSWNFKYKLFYEFNIVVLGFSFRIEIERYNSLI